MIKKRFQVNDMKCVGCTIAVEGALEDVAGVKSASANYAKQFADIEYDESKVSPRDLAAAVALAGYEMVLPADS
jgi:copper chaperone CopZ